MTRDTPIRTLPLPLGLLMLASVVPLVGHIPWWILLSLSALVIWRLTGTPLLPLPPRSVRWLAAILVALAIFLRFHTFIGERPGIAFFMMLYGLKLTETETRRDLMVLALLSYVGLLGGMLYDPGIGMGFFSAGFLVLSFTVLAGIVSPQVPLGARVRQAGLFFVQALPVAALVYIVFPRVAGGFWGHQNVAIGQTGVSRVLRPGSISDLVQSRKVALRVIFDGTPPPPAARYFRVYVLSKTDGRTWRPGAPFAKGVTTGRPRIRYTVLLNPSDHKALPALDWPLAAPAPYRLESGGVLAAAQPVRHLLRYRLASGPARMATLTARERAADLRVPAGIGARVVALGRRLAAGGGGGKAIAGRVFGYFLTRHFVYTLTPPPMGARPVARFLFTVRAGYCEDYAAAFAILMRAAGVPARVVVGYVGGRYNPDGGDVVVRERDAHAWDECWIGGRWQRFDPTAVVAPGAIRYGIGAFSRMLARGQTGKGPLGLDAWTRLARFLAGWHDAAVTGWDNWIVSYGWQRQERLLAQLGWKGAHRISLAAGLLGLTALLLYVVRLYGGRQKRPADPALALYQRYQARLARIGLPARGGEGPLAFCARVIRARPDLGPAVQHITQAYIGIRYGGEKHRLPALRRAVWRFLPRAPRS